MHLRIERNPKSTEHKNILKQTSKIEKKFTEKNRGKSQLG